MKIKLISDLHIDHHLDKGASLIKSIPADDHDILVIAGDLLEINNNIDLFHDTWDILSSKFKKIIYTEGNHEFWGGNPWSIDLLIDEVLQEFNNVVRLKPGESHLIDNHRFIGGPLWYPDNGDKQSQRDFADFMMIENHAKYVFNENQKFVDMFKNGFAKRNDIVISHHLPSYKLVAPKFKHFNNDFFVCPMDHYIYKIKPLAWFHGHSHVPNNIMIDHTWFVSNPLGYPTERSGFDEKLVLEMIVC